MRKVVNENGGATVLARKLGVQSAAVYYWMSGRSLPDYDSLVRIATTVDVELDWLLGVR